MSSRVAFFGFRAAAVALLAVIGCSPLALADDASVRRENQLKAAYLVNFVKFVEWPPPANGGSLTVCFVGGGGVYDALAAGIESKKAGNRPLAVGRRDTAMDQQGCNVLYLDAEAASGGRYSDSAIASSTAPTLTVSDAKDFARNGGMIELFTDNNRLRFNINVANAQKAGLRISSSLLQLAAAIENGERK